MSKFIKELWSSNAADRLKIGRTIRKLLKVLANLIGENTIPRLLNYRYVMTGTILSYSLFFFFISSNKERTQYKVSLSRRLSRMTGRAASMPLPPHLRVYIYKAFGLIYGVNFDDIKVDDLNKFRTFN